MAHYILVAFVAVVLVALAVIDIRTRRLPNRVVLPAAVVVLAAQMAIAPDRALEWVAAALGAFALLFAARSSIPAGSGWETSSSRCCSVPRSAGRSSQRL